MLLDLSEIVMRRGMEVPLEVEQAGVEDPDLVFAEPIRGHLDFANGGDVINFHGNLETALTVPCSRCLTDVRVPLELQVEEHFPVEQVLNPTRKPDPEEELDTTVSSVVYIEQGRPILDLDELMRQLIVIEVPLRTVCDEACAGLCPHCGVNRNEMACLCAEQERNTPLAGLSALLQDEASEDGAQQPPPEKA